MTWKQPKYVFELIEKDQKLSKCIWERFTENGQLLRTSDWNIAYRNNFKVISRNLDYILEFSAKCAYEGQIIGILQCPCKKYRIMGWPVWPYYYSHHYFYGNSYSFPRKKGEFHKKAHALFEMMTKKIRLIFSCEIGFFLEKFSLYFSLVKTHYLLGEFSIHFRAKGDLNGTKSR